MTNTNYKIIALKIKLKVRAFTNSNYINSIDAQKLKTIYPQLIALSERVSE